LTERLAWTVFELDAVGFVIEPDLGDRNQAIAVAAGIWHFFESKAAPNPLAVLAFAKPIITRFIPPNQSRG
jgi:hypothetical protein